MLHDPERGRWQAGPPLRSCSLAIHQERPCHTRGVQGAEGTQGGGEQTLGEPWEATPITPALKTPRAIVEGRVFDRQGEICAAIKVFRKTLLLEWFRSLYSNFSFYWAIKLYVWNKYADLASNRAIFLHFLRVGAIVTLISY